MRRSAYPQRAVPATRAQRHAVGANSQATDPILMAGQHSHPLAFQGIPNVAGPVVVSTKEYTTRNRECDGCDAAKDVIMGEGVEFAVRADIEQPA